ncbi:MAG: hypothetical protein HY716_11500 [Planctomycetes bacterium]|nr:hypothetical protein [Planctomycetota bacterium]
MRPADVAQWVLAIGGFTALCADAAIRLPERYPGIQRCVRQPHRYQGSDVLILPSTVLESSESHFVLDVRGLRVRVDSTLQPSPGDHVMVRGDFHDAASVKATAVRMVPGYTFRRAGVYAVSVLALIAFAWIFRRRFEWRREGLYPR